MQENVERLLARLFADRKLRERFLTNCVEVAAQSGLSPEECHGLAMLPAQDLQTAASSFERKRRLKLRHAGFHSMQAKVLRRLAVTKALAYSILKRIQRLLRFIPTA